MGEPDFSEIDRVVEESLQRLETLLQNTEQAARRYAESVERLVNTYQTLADAARAELPTSEPAEPVR